MLNELSKKIHENAILKGFYDSERNLGEMLCLIHSEVSEALEALRTNQHAFGLNETNLFIKGMTDKDFGHTFEDDEFFKNYFECRVKNSFEDELADIIIRVLDLAAYKNIDIESHVKAKIRYNSLRQYKHGKNF